MVIFINGSFGMGKTTVSRLLASELPGSAVFDPEPMGVVLSRLAMLWPLQRRTDDFQDLAVWRLIGARAIRLAHRFRSTVIVPMAFSNLRYLEEFLSHLRRHGVPVSHFCLTAPHSVVLDRLAARQPRGPTRWQLRRSAECCDAHRAPEFAEHISTVGRSANDVAKEIADRVRL
jgi:predicted kinase